MEQTFMTIHNLGPDANILYASESIVDILGYHPQEVLGRASFDFFHPDELPFARSVHSRGVLLDKAAVLHYVRVLSRYHGYVSCECCFTVVHDVLVACTSIYKRDARSERRAIEAPQIRRIFSCSPRDPRYHMLEHLSPKFKMSPMEREPRAALILNRFTRTLSVMFATDAVSTILGVSADHVVNKSFYECIQESSLDDAFTCLESAKANDSIAYLRFWSRDPRRPEDFEDEESEMDDEDDDDCEDEEEEELPDTEGGRAFGESQPSSMRKRPASQRSSDSEGGGVKLERSNGGMEVDPPIKVEPDIEMEDGDACFTESSLESRTASSAALASAGGHGAYATPLTAQSTGSAARPVSGRAPSQTRSQRRVAPSVELEAVVSCTSDGLVVVLRRARPQIPNLHPPLIPLEFDNGLFAAPWAQRPIHPQTSPERLYTFRPPLLPQYMPLRESVKAAGGPPLDQLMRSIRDVAVFAWALVGINGNIAAFSHGLPMGESQPPEGLPIWDPHAANSTCTAPENQAVQRWENDEEQDWESYGNHSRLSHKHAIDASSSESTRMAGHENYSLGQRGHWQPGTHAHPAPQDRPYLGQSQPRELPKPWEQSNLPASVSNHWSDVFGRQGHGNGYGFNRPSKDETRDAPYMWKRGH